MKRCAGFFAIFVLCCLLFFHQIVGAIVGFAAKLYLDTDVHYKKVRVENGELVFKELTLFNPSMQMSAPSLKIALQWHSTPRAHITLESPHISIQKIQPLPKSDSLFEWGLTVKKGTIDLGGLAHFSLEFTDETLQGSIDWDDASLIVKKTDEKMLAHFENLQLPLLRSQIPFVDLSQGRASGWLTLDENFDPVSSYVTLDNASIHIAKSSFEKIEGSFSYNAHLGTKWQLKGEAHSPKGCSPFLCEGKGFFSSQWLESEITLNEASCQIQFDQNWTVSCSKFTKDHIAIAQSCFALRFPFIDDIDVKEGLFFARATIRPDEWEGSFTFENCLFTHSQTSLPFDRIEGEISSESINASLIHPEGSLEIHGPWEQFDANLHYLGADIAAKGKLNGTKIDWLIENAQYESIALNGPGWVNVEGDFAFSFQGKYSQFGKNIPFQISHIAKCGSQILYDFRIPRDSWDLARICGSIDTALTIDTEKSHLLGSKLQIHELKWDAIDIAFDITDEKLSSCYPFLEQFGAPVHHIPLVHQAHLSFHFNPEQFQFKAQSEEPQFDFLLTRQKDNWDIEIKSDLLLTAQIKKDWTFNGTIEYLKQANGSFQGKIMPDLSAELSITKGECDLTFLGDPRLLGSVEGSGHLIYTGGLEADFDLTTKNLVILNEPMENYGRIHLNYNSQKGVQLRGVNLHGSYDCLIDLLEYKQPKNTWVFHKAQIHIPTNIFPEPFKKVIDPDRELNFVADLDFAADFSTVNCHMQEGSIPHAGLYRHIENLNLEWNHSRCDLSFIYGGDLFRADFQVAPNKYGGKLYLGEEEVPLCIEWEYTDSLRIHAIEGAFSGINASFHSESANLLVGSAQVDFGRIKTKLPVEIAQVFDEIHMGSGYELKGRLDCTNPIPSFKGILTGKEIELFGFQFRTILAQVDLNYDFVRLFDIKISDKAGSMKIDDIVCQGTQETPWTIQIPKLTILDLRPSFLLRPGGALGPMDPLVVRRLTIEDFQGFLDESHTWTAKGSLHFINSFKRGETVFDYPANLLSRIAGLDLELLIPVRGDLTFDLKEGYFHLQELSNAFSVGDRSEFFLEMDPSPTMDLDGNLKIFIKMKQFVLLKFTESFLINIDGRLDDPKVHLRKKKFLGIF